MAGKGKKHPGERRPASPTEPAVIETKDGPILVYRLPLGRVSFVYPTGKGMRVPKIRKQQTKAS